MTGYRTAAIGLLIALGATAAVIVPMRLDAAPVPAAAAAAQPSEGQIAQRTIDRYFTLIDQSRGTTFCNEAVTATTVYAEGGVFRCAARIDGYVKSIQRRTFAAAVTDMHLLFYMVSDGIGSHCWAGRRCPQQLYGRWAEESAAPPVSWRTSSNPRAASSLDGKVVAVVDPRRSNPKRITLYYQASDGRILRASWSTAFGAWRGSVVDTHAGDPFISDTRVLATWKTHDGALVALVSMRLGTAAPIVERFRLVNENGSWRADSWANVTNSLTA
jgi:hypothetical protein